MSRVHNPQHPGEMPKEDVLPALALASLLAREKMTLA